MATLLDATEVRTSAPKMRTIDRTVAWISSGALAAAVLYAWATISPRNGMLVLVGSLLGASLYHASFGFTGGWRAFVREGRSASLRAQLLLLALTSVLLIPMIAAGDVFGRPVHGFVAPLNLSLLIGSFIFGIGMQLGGGCGSGTLFTVGGGSVRMLITLAAFIAGSVIGVSYAAPWSSLPDLGSYSLWQSFGPAPTLLGTTVVLGVLAFAVARIERRRTGKLVPLGTCSVSSARFLQGSWPLLWGAVALAVLSAVTLVVAGHPWGITGAFALWGVKIMSAVGIDVGSWQAWSGAGANAQLNGSLFAHPVSAMDIGLIMGAMIASSLAGKFAPKVDLSPGSLAAAIVGGLLMGYGARLSSGCNIGALLGGIASGSLHGWIWFAMAFMGSLLGIRLRPFFRLKN